MSQRHYDIHNMKIDNRVQDNNMPKMEFICKMCIQVPILIWLLVEFSISEDKCGIPILMWLRVCSTSGIITAILELIIAMTPSKT